MKLIKSIIELSDIMKNQPTKKLHDKDQFKTQNYTDGFFDLVLIDYRILIRSRYDGYRYILFEFCDDYNSFHKILISEEMIDDIKTMDDVMLVLTHGRIFLDSEIKKKFGIKDAVFSDLLTFIEELKE